MNSRSGLKRTTSERWRTTRNSGSDPIDSGCPFPSLLSSYSCRRPLSRSTVSGRECALQSTSTQRCCSMGPCLVSEAPTRVREREWPVEPASVQSGTVRTRDWQTDTLVVE